MLKHLHILRHAALALLVALAVCCAGGVAMAQDQAAAPADQAAAPAATPPACAASVTTPCAVNSGDTAWMLTSVALVLMMTVPGLGLFYGGMVRKKNVADTVMTSFAVTCLVTVLYTVVTYTMSFTTGGPFLGGFTRLFMQGITSDIAKGVTSTNGLAPTIPETVYACFQMTFAIITPALIAGAFAERMKFSSMLWFMTAWSLLVYAPIAHWVWGPGGYLNDAGVLDFAGGTVVHINAGVAGLVACLIMGKRKGLGTEHFAPHNLVLSVIGAGLLWVGWFGFNAGSAGGANTNAGMAMAVTQIATAAAALAWMFVEWAMKGKPSVLGIISGAVAGLVAITPASGFVDPTGGLIIGIAAGVGCYFGATSVKKLFGYDDSLDAFGVHGIGGMIGALLTGVFAKAAIGGDGKSGWIDGNPGQILTQVEGIAFTVVYCAIASFVIFKVLDMVLGLRVEAEVERDGLDLALHGEAVL